jgi:hypothetical protein
LAETLGRTTGRPAEGRGAAKITATRHLAAMLAAKVAGYSRLMGGGRGRHARTPQSAAPRARRLENRPASWPRRQHHHQSRHFVGQDGIAAAAELARYGLWW